MRTSPGYMSFSHNPYLASWLSLSFRFTNKPVTVLGVHFCLFVIKFVIYPINLREQLCIKTPTTYTGWMAMWFGGTHSYRHPVLPIPCSWFHFKRVKVTNWSLIGLRQNIKFNYSIMNWFAIRVLYSFTPPATEPCVFSEALELRYTSLLSLNSICRRKQLNSTHSSRR